MKKISLLILILFIGGAFNPKPAYQIFSGNKSKALDFDKMMDGLMDADVVFFGETHHNSVGHWLELQVLKSLKEVTGKEVIVGAEMFESDDQLVLNEYKNGIIKKEHFKKGVKFWKNYDTDYAPLFNFAKTDSLAFIATNVPRRYASLVASKGLPALDQLDEEAKKYIAPLPIEVDYELPSYIEVAKMAKIFSGNTDMDSIKMVGAQAIKDATMSHFISKNLTDGAVMIHFNGTFHSQNKEGIVHYLQKARPELNIITITMVSQEKILELEEENQSLADYIIAIPEDMTKTY